MPFSLLRRAVLTFVLLAVGAVGLRAEEAKPAEKKHDLTPKSAEAFGKLDPILKASNWDTAIVMLKGILAEAPPDSWDRALGSFILAQVYLQHGQTKGLDKAVAAADYAAAIPLLEFVITSGYYEKAKQIDFYLILAQLYLQSGNTEKAEERAMQWLEGNPKPTQEGIIFNATMKYQRATRDPKNIDLKTLDEVVTLTNRAFRTFLKPAEYVFLLKAVSLQTLERLREASEVLELMVAAYPTNGQYWAQLYAAYANQSLPLRAAITIERAQARGLMTTPRENLTLATLYYNMEQLDKAVDLLQYGLGLKKVPAGVVAGPIEAERSTYELLGFALQRRYREPEAIEVYKEASKHFKTGQFDATIGTLYYALNQYPEALKYSEVALTKGELDNEYSTLMFATYVAYELKQYEKALKFALKAEPLAKTKNDQGQTAGLKKAIEDQLAILETAKAAAAPSSSSKTP